MTNTELFNSFGNLILPIDDIDPGNSLYNILDKGHNTLINLFKDSIITNLDPIFQLAKVGTSLENSASVVSTTLPFAASHNVLKTFNAQYPILFLARDGDGIYNEFTIHQEKLTQIWSLDYVLGPLILDDERKLGALASAIPKIISLTIDSIYNIEGFSAIKIVSHKIGKARFSEDPAAPEYLGTFMIIETVELANDLNEYPYLTQTQLTVDSEEDDGTTTYIALL